MKMRVWLCVGGLVLLAALGLWQVSTGDTFFRQKRNMALARDFAPIVKQRLDAVAEFKHLRVQEYTAAGGSLLVSGDIVDSAAQQRVIGLVAQTSPPVQVVYHLFPTNEVRLKWLTSHAHEKVHRYFE